MYIAYICWAVELDRYPLKPLNKCTYLQSIRTLDYFSFGILMCVMLHKFALVNEEYIINTKDVKIIQYVHCMYISNKLKKTFYFQCIIKFKKDLSRLKVPTLYL